MTAETLAHARVSEENHLNSKKQPGRLRRPTGLRKETLRCNGNPPRERTALITLVCMLTVLAESVGGPT